MGVLEVKDGIPGRRVPARQAGILRNDLNGQYQMVEPWIHAAGIIVRKKAGIVRQFAVCFPAAHHGAGRYLGSQDQL